MIHDTSIFVIDTLCWPANPRNVIQNMLCSEILSATRRLLQDDDLLRGVGEVVRPV